MVGPLRACTVVSKIANLQAQNASRCGEAALSDVCFSFNFVWFCSYIYSKASHMSFLDNISTMNPSICIEFVLFILQLKVVPNLFLYAGIVCVMSCSLLCCLKHHSTGHHTPTAPVAYIIPALPSGNRYRTLKFNRARLRKSLIPAAIDALNSRSRWSVCWPVTVLLLSCRPYDVYCVMSMSVCDVQCLSFL